MYILGEIMVLAHPQNTALCTQINTETS